MAKRTKKSKTKQPTRDGLNAKLVAEPTNLPAGQSSVETFLKRRDEIGEKDREDFQAYLAAKKEADNRKLRPLAPTTERRRRFSRRTLFGVAAGTAVVAEAGVVGYNVLGNSAATDSGARLSGAVATEPQRHGIVREITDNAADLRGQSLGKWIALLPTKMGGGTYAIDLNSNRVLASIWYWN